MDSGQLLSLCLAALCMTTLGVAATTLDDTVSKTPDDVFDPNLDTLPLGEDSAKEIDRELDSNRQQSATTGEEGQQTSSGGNSQSGEAQSSSSTAPAKAQAFPNDFLSLLTRLLLALLVVGLGAGLVYRYRDRLAALLLAALPVGDSGTPDTADAASHPWEDGQCSNEVQRAWYTMVTASDIDRPWAKTPAECREMAIDAGLDPDAVSRLTDLFREVRYAETQPTSDHEHRARETLSRLDVGGETL